MSQTNFEVEKTEIQAKELQVVLGGATEEVESLEKGVHIGETGEEKNVN